MKNVIYKVPFFQSEVIRTSDWLLEVIRTHTDTWRRTCHHPASSDFHTILGKVFSILAGGRERGAAGGHRTRVLQSLCDANCFPSWLAGTEQTKCCDCACWLLRTQLRLSINTKWIQSYRIILAFLQYQRLINWYFWTTCCNNTLHTQSPLINSNENKTNYAIRIVGHKIIAQLVCTEF